MIALSIENMIGLIWLAFCLMASTVAIGFFVWAIRSRQFRDQRHASYLPLEAGDLEEEQEEESNDDPQTPER